MMMDQPDREGDSSSSARDSEFGALRFAGAGLELAGVVLVFGALGVMLDRYVDLETPWGFIGGAMLGFLLGMMNLFRLVLRYNR